MSAPTRCPVVTADSWTARAFGDARSRAVDMGLLTGEWAEAPALEWTLEGEDKTARTFPSNTMEGAEP